ncbi:unnamed protein product [Malus baccata var. baccata]
MKNPYENSLKFDHSGGSDGSYLDDRYRGYNRSRSDLGSDLYGKRYDVVLVRVKVICMFIFLQMQSNSYTANILLDTVTAATIQREATITEAQALGPVVHSQGPLFGGVQRNVKSSSDKVVVCWRSLDNLNFFFITGISLAQFVIHNGYSARGVRS